MTYRSFSDKLVHFRHCWYVTPLFLTVNLTRDFSIYCTYQRTYCFLLWFSSLLSYFQCHSVLLYFFSPWYLASGLFCSSSSNMLRIKLNRWPFIWKRLKERGEGLMSFESGNVIPQPYQGYLPILCVCVCVWLHKNFWIIFSGSVNNVIRYCIGITLNLQIASGGIGIITIRIPPMHDHWASFLCIIISSSVYYRFRLQVFLLHGLI